MTGPGGLKEAGTAVVSRGEGRVRAPCWGYDFAAFSGPPLPPSADERKIIPNLRPTFAATTPPPRAKSCREDMRFDVEDLVVEFPYERIYAEQYAYMLALKRSLDRKGHSLLELPMGGRTVAVLSLITSYQRAHPEACRKLVYCTNTVAEMDKVLETLALLEAHRDELLGEGRPRLLGLGLAADSTSRDQKAVLEAFDCPIGTKVH